MYTLANSEPLTSIAKTIPSQVKSGEAGVEQDEISNGFCPIFLPNLAPAHLQDIYLHTIQAAAVSID